jgi:hypothetical protein
MADFQRKWNTCFLPRLPRLWINSALDARISCSCPHPVESAVDRYLLTRKRKTSGRW